MLTAILHQRDGHAAEIIVADMVTDLTMAVAAEPINTAIELILRIRAQHNSVTIAGGDAHDPIYVLNLICTLRAHAPTGTNGGIPVKILNPSPQLTSHSPPLHTLFIHVGRGVAAPSPKITVGTDGIGGLTTSSNGHHIRHLTAGTAGAAALHHGLGISGIGLVELLTLTQLTIVIQAPGIDSAAPA